jgi:hypothetical protein
MEGPQMSDTSLISADRLEGGVQAIVTREQEEIRAMMTVAKNFPRDEELSRKKLLAACKRPAFADEATYNFPRGKTEITGPSVQLAREAARVWGNVRYGLRIVEDTADQVHVRGYAHDLETNAMGEAEDKFAKRQQRTFNQDGERITKWIRVDDERDLRELINRRGAICVRNAILQLMPPDLIEECTAIALETQIRTEKGESSDKKKATPAETRAQLVAAFAEYGIQRANIDAFLGHPLDASTAEDHTRLRGIYKSIRDGNTKPTDHFKDLAAEGPKLASTTTGDLESRAVLTKLLKLVTDKQVAPQSFTDGMSLLFGKTDAKLLAVEQMRELIKYIELGELEGIIDQARGPKE